VIYAIVPVVVALTCIWLGRRLLTVVVIFAYLAIEGFLKLLSNYNPIVHVGIDLVVLTVALIWVLDAVATRSAKLPHLPWVKLIALYALWVVLQLFNPYSPGIVPALASFKAHLTMIPLYFIGAALVRSREDVVRLFAALAAIALVPYAAALIQYALGPASVLDLSPRYWQNISFYHEWRPFGTSAVPGGESVLAFLVVPLALVLVVTPGIGARLRGLALISIALAAGTFVVSGVRQMMLGCVLALAAMGALAASRGRSRVALGAMVVLLIGAGAYVSVQAFLEPISTENVRRDPRSPQIWRERDVTQRLLSLAQTGTYLEARRGAWNAITYRLTRYPFGAGLGRTGAGAGAFRAQLSSTPEGARLQQEVGWSDNFFADELVEAGIPGLAMLTTLLVGLLWGAARLARRARDPLITSASAAIAGLFFTYLVISWGSQPLLANPTLAFFWFLAGVLAALRRIEASDDVEAVPTVPDEQTTLAR
jgi:hypothetical protein